MTLTLDDTFNCKICFIAGEGSVGNTSIINRYVDNKFYINTPNTTTQTYSWKFEKMKYKNKNIGLKFEIWDTTGNQRYKELSRNFYLNAGIEAFVLVYDVTSRESFEALKDSLIPDILVNIKEDNEDISKK